MNAQDSSSSRGELVGDLASRVDTIDIVRGLAIVIMAIDHSRDFFGDVRIPTEDPATSTWPLFLTRFVTHFCAPTFVFLAGVSAWHYGQKNSSRTKLVGFLVSRGCWLVLLEFTVVYFSIALSVNILPWMFLVLGAIGVSMIALATVCWLPSRLVLALGLVICCGHNLLDGISAERFGDWGWLWTFLHDGPGYVPSANLDIGYPVLAWMGVMMLGFGMGPIFQWPSSVRRRFFFSAGLAVIACFLLIRAVNGYGNSQPWQWQASESRLTAPAGEPAPGVITGLHDVNADGDTNSVSLSRTAISFLAPRKYPPSLAFLLMTLGPTLLALGVFDGRVQETRVARALKTFGRASLFFYLIHFYVLHLASILVYWFVRGRPLSPFQAVYGQMHGREIPPEFGFSTIWQIYVAWGMLIVLMYPLCRWYSEFRRQSSNPFWSYL